MNPTPRSTLFVVLPLLMLLMALTRFHSLGAMLHLQDDASWAVFFVAGFYLARQWRWAFPLLMAEAVIIDLISVRHLGVSNYCVTLAYWFLVPSYGALWLGGSWLSRHAAISLRGAVLMTLSLVAAASVCFLISNGSFYWLGGRAAERSVAGWISNLSIWYGPFMRAPLMYVAIAAVLHVTAVQVFGFGAADRKKL